MRIQVVVHLHAKRPKVLKNTEGVLHIYTAAVPEDGKANEAVRKMLAAHLGVAISHVVLIRGMTSRQKEFMVK